MRAPQYGLPRGPNPAIAKGLHVAPFANIFALVENLGAISLHRTEADAKTALEAELKRRSSLPAFGLTTPGEVAPGRGDSERGQPIAAPPATDERANERKSGD